MRALRRLVPRRYHYSYRLRAELRRISGGRVLSGPFAGMLVGENSFGSVLLPKLVGSYELELRPAVEAAVARSPRHVIVAGAAEGYYAIGFSLRLPSAEIAAFEPRPEAREALRRLAELNGVRDRIRIAGLCGAGDLREALEGVRSVLVLCDIEGAEAVLMDPTVVPALIGAELLIETHDFLVPGVEETIVQRFLHTHDVARVAQRSRRIEDAPRLDLPRAFQGALLQAMNEHRPVDNRWLHLIP